MFHARVAAAPRLPTFTAVLLFMSVAMTAPAHAGNQRPTIAGSPATTAVVGSQYYFQAQGYDPEGAPLRYSIQNKPSWASFGATTGVLSGTPTAPGVWSNVRITANDGRSTSSALRFSITVSGSTNRAPTISATPAPSVIAGQLYSFRPAAADADNDTLGFSIQNKPVWATFSSVTGQLSGAPAASDVGTYSNILISVSDGKTSAALPAFAIAVVDVSTGAAALTWTPPTANTDGSTLTDLAGYRIAYGLSASQLTQTIQVANAGVSSYLIENLAPGTYYFAVRSYTSSGGESANSNVVTKVVQ